MSNTECLHAWVAGMMYVDEQDLDWVARARAKWGETVECEKCDMTYAPGQDNVVGDQGA